MVAQGLVSRRGALAAGAGLAVAAIAGPAMTAPSFPVKPELFIDDFQGAEGLTFNAAGQLFIGANNQIWRVEPDGAKVKIADVDRHLGQAPIGARDILAADFGPTNAFEGGPNSDGVVWRITPEGAKTVVARDIGDPNAVLVLRGGSFLVSDDAIDKIYRVVDGVTSVWTSQVPFPNGMVLSRDGRTVYVAQIFTTLKPTTGSNQLWAIPLEPGGRAGRGRVIARVGDNFLDGLAADSRGRIYVADNGGGKLWRFDPRTRKSLLLAQGMPGLASLAFGQGSFDPTAIYATTTARGGGRIWKIPVGATAGRLFT